jgi:hypothetical protein
VSTPAIVVLVVALVTIVGGLAASILVAVLAHRRQVPRG